MEQSSTPYDDAFRTLLVYCSRLILYLINEAFGEHYSGDEEIRFSQNEHFLKWPEGEEKRITDSSFEVTGKDGRKRYHFEVQATDDGSLLLRMMQYDMMIALESGSVEANVIKVTFPHSAVLFLRRTEKTPEALFVRLETPGGDVEYPVAVMNVQDYGIDEIFAKKLYFLIPFYIFTHEKRFGQYEKSDEKLGTLIAEYTEILRRLGELAETGEIADFTRRELLDMSVHVLNGIAKKYTNVRKGVESVMGGKIIETEATKILKRGIDEGRAEGHTNGMIEMVRNFLKADTPMEYIVKASGMSEEAIRALAT